jgi:hypothetical protein
MPKATDRVLLVIGDERHLLDPDKLLLSEVVAAEKVTGMTWPEIWVGINRGQAQAVQVVVWLMRKRSNPRLRLSEVEFSMGEYRLKDPDFDPDYWIPEGDDDVLPDDDTIPGDDDTEQDPGDPKDPEEQPQDTSPPLAE